jgi:hypothetical protein
MIQKAVIKMNKYVFIIFDSLSKGIEKVCKI